MICDMKPAVSILISSHERLPLFKRCLASIARRPPSCSFEVVVADDGSSTEVERLVRSQPYLTHFIPVDRAGFERRTGVRPFWNCPAWTNNVAFAGSQGDYLFQMGNEIIAWEDAFDHLLNDLPETRYAWAVSRTYDLPQELLARLDPEGSNLSREDVEACSSRLLSNDNNVPNYLSVFTRPVWEALGGYDERYLAGIGAEDSDFMRRAFALPNFKAVRSKALSLHQYHGGVSHLYRPLPSVIGEGRLAEGVAINRRLYQAWDGGCRNRQPWPVGVVK